MKRSAATRAPRAPPAFYPDQLLEAHGPGPPRFCAALSTLILLIHSTTWAAEKPDVIELERMTVTESPPGSIPFACRWYYNRLTSSVIVAPVMRHQELRRLYFEGEAGQPVRLVIRDSGPEMHLFREITVRRISKRKREQHFAEVADDTELKPARSLAELPATPEPR